MGILKSTLNFLFGKNPEIFDERGQVSHKLSRKKWEAWHNRTKIDPENNWRNHSGITGLTNQNKKKQ